MMIRSETTTFIWKDILVTRFVYPPIPIRQFDWCCYIDGEEEAGNYGWGRTEEEAVKDFLENYEP